MGITNFHTWLRKNYPNIYLKIQDNNVYDYIYIDVNFVLHNSVYDCKTDDEFKRKLYVQLDIIFSNFIATKKVFFDMDGPSSYAKIMLQRKRRTAGAQSIVPGKVTSLYITPGTESMTRIEGYLDSYMQTIKQKYKYTTPEFVISKSAEFDEGEIKICRQVIENGLLDINCKHLIIGNDSDLIVLSMGMKPIYNINLLVKSKKNNELISLKNLISDYAKSINRSDTIDILSKSNIRDDFVMISIMMGNDYLPKLGCISYDKLWKLYWSYIKIINKDDTLIKDGMFNQQLMSNFMLLVYKNLQENYKKISPNSYNFKRTKSYLDGLIWCLNMYQTGKCPKYDYMYYGTKSPNPYELLFYLSSEENIQIPTSDTKPIPVDIYPLIVMPRKASYLIPEKYRHLVHKELDYLYKVEECKKCHAYHESFSKTSKEMTTKRLDGENYDDLKTDYSKKLKEFSAHKKTHKMDFTIDDINKILQIVANNNL